MGSLESRGRQPLRAGRGQAHTDLEPTYHGTPAGPAGSRPDVGAGSPTMAPNITKKSPDNACGGPRLHSAANRTRFGVLLLAKAPCAPRLREQGFYPPPFH